MTTARQFTRAEFIAYADDVIRSGRLTGLASEVELGEELLALAQEWPEQPEARDENRVVTRVASGPACPPRTRKPKLSTLIRRAKVLGIDVVLAPDGAVTFRTGAPTNSESHQNGELTTNPWDEALNVTDKKRPS